MYNMKNKTLLDYFQEKNKTLTPTRLLIYKLFSEKKKPYSAYELKEDLQKLGKKLNISTIYRVISFFVELGLLHKLPSINKFLLCAKPNEKHIHMLNLCTKCEKVFETCNVSMGINFDNINLEHEMVINPDHSIEVPVICSNCK